MVKKQNEQMTYENVLQGMFVLRDHNSWRKVASDTRDANDLSQVELMDAGFVGIKAYSIFGFGKLKKPRAYIWFLLWVLFVFLWQAGMFAQHAIITTIWLIVCSAIFAGVLRGAIMVVRRSKDK
jgi:hypothetical protein